MSFSVGVCFPYSILDSFELCQPASTAGAQPVKPGSFRGRRSRWPSVSRAWCTVFDTGSPRDGRCADVDAVRDGARPDRFIRAPAPVNDDRVHSESTADEPALGFEHGEDNPAIVEQPEVVGRQLKVSGAVAWQPANVLAGVDVARRDGEPPAYVIGMRNGHDPYPFDTPAGAGDLADESQPRLVPGEVVALAFPEQPEGSGLL